MVDVVAAFDRRTDDRLSWVLSVALAGAATGLVLGAGYLGRGRVRDRTERGRDPPRGPRSRRGRRRVRRERDLLVGGRRAVREPGVLRGAVAGVASGLLAHPVMWSAIVLAVAVAPTVDATRTPSTSLTSATLELARIVAIATATSWLVLGWFAAVAGGTLGALLGRRRARVTAE